MTHHILEDCTLQFRFGATSPKTLDISRFFINEDSFEIPLREVVIGRWTQSFLKTMYNEKLEIQDSELLKRISEQLYNISICVSRKHATITPSRDEKNPGLVFTNFSPNRSLLISSDNTRSILEEGEARFLVPDTTIYLGSTNRDYGPINYKIIQDIKAHNPIERYRTAHPMKEE